MPFVLVDPVENERELARLAKTPEGARAIRNFDLECEFRMKIKELRKQSNLTQTEIARISGLTQQAISRLERGEQAQGASISTLLRYADALGLELNFIRK